MASEELAIDFDEVKKSFHRKLKADNLSFNTPTSADALFYNADKDAIVFVEMKDFTKEMKDFINEMDSLFNEIEIFNNEVLKHNQSATPYKSDNLERYAQKFINTSQKLTVQAQMTTFVDSVSILLHLCAHFKEIDLLNELYKMKYHFLVAINVSDRDFENSGLKRILADAKETFKIGFIKPTSIMTITSSTFKKYLQSEVF